MKVCFFHDSTFIKDEETYYTCGALNNELLEKYTDAFGELTIVTRYQEANSSNSKFIKDENKITLDNVRFNCVKKYHMAFKIIEKEVRNCDFAILRTHSFISTIAYFYLRKYNKRYIVESVSCAFDCLWYHSLPGKFVSIPMYILTKKIVKNAYAVVYVSERFLQKRYPTRGIELACSDVMLSNISVNNLESRLGRELNMENRKIILGNISNVDIKYKGHKYILQAMRILIEEGHDLELRLVGGGTGKRIEKLKKKYGLEERVKLVGPLPHNEIFNFIKDIDIYIQPSNAESHGRVIIEAFSMACPVIGSSTGGIPELVEKDFVFKRKKYKDLVAKIKKMCNSDIRKVAINNFGAAKAFSKEELINKRYGFYKKIMEQINNEGNNEK